MSWVEAAVGVYLSFSLLWRASMSMPFAVFDLMQRKRGQCARLDDTVRQELQWMRGYLPLIYMDLGVRTIPFVAAQARSARSSVARNGLMAMDDLLMTCSNKVKDSSPDLIAA